MSPTRTHPRHRTPAGGASPAPVGPMTAGKLAGIAAMIACAGLASPALGQAITTDIISGFTDFGPNALCETGDSTITIPASPDGLQLVNLLQILQDFLGINILVKGDLQGTWTLRSPIELRCDQALMFANELLEAWDFSINRAPSGIYTVQPVGELRPGFDGEFATTRIIRTPNVRPTGLQDAINALLGTGQPQQQGVPGTQQSTTTSGLIVSYIDDLGVIVAKGTPGKLATLERLVNELLATYSESSYHRVPLEHVAAPVARERTIELLGASSGSDATANQNARFQNPQIAAQLGGLTSGTLANIGGRLSVDPQGNGLFFYGTANEAEKVRELVSIIDVANALEAKQYFAGSAAASIADFASRNGLGEVVRFGNEQEELPQFQVRGNQANFGTGTDSESMVGGPTMVVNERKGTILYYGTPSQQARLEGLISQIDPDQEKIVVETYRLKNADAEEVADLINGLISEGAQSDENSLLPNQAANRAAFFPFGQQPEGGTEFDGGFSATAENVFVIADISNNQVVVKAPQVQQREVAQLIERIDLRRAQVYIDVTIIAIDNTDMFRFAVESQILAGQFGIQSVFGLTQDSTDFQNRRSIAPNLPGLTTGLIKSDYVPFVINAIETDSRGRILSSPQVLVNDNEEATVQSTEEQPTATTSQGDGSTVTGFNDFQEAGTTLTVTPSISESGYIRLEYTVNLSNFIGSGTDVLPPARLTRELTGLVTVPSDSTVVLGGITVDNRQKSVSKIPLLGDIPLIGALFSDTTNNDTGTILYVFITPRILTDPDFNDLRLLTEGPQATVFMDPDVPPMEAQTIEILPAPRTAPDRQTPLLRPTMDRGIPAYTRPPVNSPPVNTGLENWEPQPVEDSPPMDEPELIDLPPFETSENP